MKKSLLNYVRPLIVCFTGLCIIVFFAACSGVATTTDANGNQTGQLQGKVLTVDANAHSATFLVNGQQVTVNDLTAQQITTLQTQQGKTFTLQVTSTGQNTYTVKTNTDIQVSDNPAPTATSATNAQPTTTNNPPATTNSAPGTLDFIGKVQSINASSVTITMPNGEAIPMAINALTEREHFLNGQPTVGQQVKVDSYTNPDGSFTAKKLDIVKPDDQADTFKMNTVDFKGVTTSAIGGDNVLHFNVGTKSYSFALNSTTRLKDFVNAQSIAANQPVKVEVLFTGSNGSVTKVENGIS